MQKQKNTKLKKWQLLAGAVAAVAAVVLPSVSTYAYGPERTTFTMANPADYITFNSITDNNVIGDERDFVRVVEVGSGKEYSNEVKIEPGKTYSVYIFYHNGGKSSLNASGKGIANNTVVSSQFPATVNSSAKGKVSAIITSPYANPTQVWDEAYFTTDSEVDVVLRYVDASAKIYNRGSTNGSVLSEALFKDGTFIGVNSLDGRIPACSEYSGHIIYQLKAEQVGAKVTKSVSKDGTNFFDKVTANPGDTLTYKVEFENTGTTELTHVTFHDKLPSGVTLVPGTTYLVDNVGNKTQLSDLIGQNGYDTGLYGVGVKATLTYQVKINSDIIAKESCGTHAYSNKIFVDHDDGEISDSATFEVVKTGCDIPEELPTTGPAEIALAITAVIAMAVGATYWYSSQKALTDAKAKATKSSSHKK